MLDGFRPSQLEYVSIEEILSRGTNSMNLMLRHDVFLLLLVSASLTAQHRALRTSRVWFLCQLRSAPLRNWCLAIHSPTRFHRNLWQTGAAGQMHSRLALAQPGAGFAPTRLSRTRLPGCRCALLRRRVCLIPIATRC